MDSIFSDKGQVVSSVYATWKFCAVPYNPSDGTGYCVFSDVPHIVIKHEPFRKLLSSLDLLIELDEKLLVHQLVNQLSSTMKRNKLSSITKEDVA